MGTVKKQSLAKRFIADTQSDLSAALSDGLDPIAEYLQTLEELSTPDLLTPSLFGHDESRSFVDSLPCCTMSTTVRWAAADRGNDAA